MIVIVLFEGPCLRKIGVLTSGRWRAASFSSIEHSKHSSNLFMHYLYIYFDLQFNDHREDADPVTRRDPKKRIALTSRLRVLNIKQKQYGKMGVLFNFMLEEVQDYGPANLGKFARYFYYYNYTYILSIYLLF